MKPKAQGVSKSVGKKSETVNPAVSIQNRLKVKARKDIKSTAKKSTDSKKRKEDKCTSKDIRQRGRSKQVKKANQRKLVKGLHHGHVQIEPENATAVSALAEISGPTAKLGNTEKVANTTTTDYDEENCDSATIKLKKSDKKIPEYIQTLKAGGKPLYRCTACFHTFKTRHNMGYHRYCREGKKPFPCEIKDCGKEFVLKSHYKYHLLVHQGVRPFVCSICKDEKSFYIQSKLNRHMRIHNGTRRFRCDICPKSFWDQECLDVHYRRHTGDKPYPCPTCDKKFVSLTAMKRHTTVHSEERPFACHCGKTFARNEQLKKHRKIHMKGQDSHMQ